MPAVTQNTAISQALSQVIAAARKADERRHGRVNESRVIAAVIASATDAQLAAIEADREKYGATWQRALAERKFWPRKIAAADRKEPPAAPHDLSAASTGAVDSATPAATALSAVPALTIGAAEHTLENPDQVHGRLLEGVHLGGYSFERAFNNLEWLLAEDRWRRVGGGFDDVNDFLAGIRLDEFRVVAEQRKRIAARIKDLQPKASNRAVARMLGADEKTIRNDAAENSAVPNKKFSKSNAAETRAAENSAPPALTGAEARIVDRANAKLEAAQGTEDRRAASRNAEPLPDGELRIGDCRTVLADVADNSVPLIITDPPFGDAAEPLYRWLAEFAARVLIQGGSLVFYTGQSRLNRDMRIFDERLRFWWQLIMPHSQSQRLPGKFVIITYKPVLWYVKEFRRGRSLVPDTLISPARDKDLHNWSQGEGGVSQLIEHLTEPGELILDPFAGTAKWGRIAAQMGRRCLGADVVAGGDTVIVAGESEPAPAAADPEPPPPEAAPGADLSSADDGIPPLLRRSRTTGAANG